MSNFPLVKPGLTLGEIAEPVGNITASHVLNETVNQACNEGPKKGQRPARLRNLNPLLRKAVGKEQVNIFAGLDYDGTAIGIRMTSDTVPKTLGEMLSSFFVEKSFSVDHWKFKDGDQTLEKKVFMIPDTKGRLRPVPMENYPSVVSINDTTAIVQLDVCTALGMGVSIRELVPILRAAGMKKEPIYDMFNTLRNLREYLVEWAILLYLFTRKYDAPDGSRKFGIELLNLPQRDMHLVKEFLKPSEIKSVLECETLEEMMCNFRATAFANLEKHIMTTGRGKPTTRYTTFCELRKKIGRQIGLMCDPENPTILLKLMTVAGSDIGSNPNMVKLYAAYRWIFNKVVCIPIDGDFSLCGERRPFTAEHFPDGTYTLMTLREKRNRGIFMRFPTVGPQNQNPNGPFSIPLKPSGTTITTKTLWHRILSEMQNTVPAAAKGIIITVSDEDTGDLAHFRLTRSQLVGVPDKELVEFVGRKANRRHVDAALLALTHAAQGDSNREPQTEKYEKTVAAFRELVQTTVSREDYEQMEPKVQRAHSDLYNLARKEFFELARALWMLGN